jgi:hypothetical protein
MPDLYTSVLDHLATNTKLCKLIAFLVQSLESNMIPLMTDKLVGDWDEARAGQKVTVTWTDPYRVEDGYLMVLPGLRADDILEGGIVHIPRSSVDETQQHWYILKYLSILADSIEIHPEY